jgi:hypothetical protein
LTPTELELIFAGRISGGVVAPIACAGGEGKTNGGGRDQHARCAMNAVHGNALGRELVQQAAQLDTGTYPYGRPSSRKQTHVIRTCIESFLDSE